MRTEDVLGQSSWRIASDRVALAVTELGGFLGPVEFKLGRRTLSPYAIPPWAGKADAPPGALGALRGDVFCVPFGGNQKPYRGEQHPPHGDTFHGQWTRESVEYAKHSTRLNLGLPLRTRPGFVRKEIIVRHGQTVVYQRHTISDVSGRMSFGYHATLDFSSFGTGLIATSPVVFGRTHLADFEDPAHGGYCSLRPNTVFRHLGRVPRLDGSLADLRSYPCEAGYENLVLLANDPRTNLGWTTVTFPEHGWVWFSLKRVSELTCTLLWLSNGGRHYAPWNGRHRARLGLEEVTALPEGLAEAAAPNEFSRRGVSVCRTFDPSEHYTVRSAAGVCAVPRGFDRVKRVQINGDRLLLTSASGRRASTAFDGTFFGSRNG